MKNEYLIHFGVPGMKWGVRKINKANKDYDNLKANNKLAKGYTRKQFVIDRTTKGRGRIVTKAVNKARLSNKNTSIARNQAIVKKTIAKSLIIIGGISISAVMLNKYTDNKNKKQFAKIIDYMNRGKNVINELPMNEVITDFKYKWT